jgi:nitroreductase
VWARHASALVLVAAEISDESGAPRSHAFYDTGLAVAGLVAQAQAEGLATHQMGGFDAAGVAETFGLAANLTPVVVVAVGRHDADAVLPEPLAARETAPRARRPLDELLIPARPRLAA